MNTYGERYKTKEMATDNNTNNNQIRMRIISQYSAIIVVSDYILSILSQPLTRDTIERHDDLSNTIPQTQTQSNNTHRTRDYQLEIVESFK